jgi:hypothetical protein
MEEDGFRGQWLACVIYGQVHLDFHAGPYGYGRIHSQRDEVQPAPLCCIHALLTKVTGGKAAGGVAGSVASLDSKLKNLENSLKELKKEAVAASAHATTANNAAEDVKGKLTKLYQENLSLKK